MKDSIFFLTPGSNESRDIVQKNTMITSNDEEMSHMRQMISKHMVDSLSTSAHVYVMTDVDMSRIVEFVKLNEVSFKNQESYNFYSKWYF